MSLTDKQQRILEKINTSIAQKGYPPTIREIGKAVGISSTSVVNYHLNKLKVLGLLERDGQISRGLKVPGDPAQSLRAMHRVPLMGFITAGEPIPVPDPRTLAEADESDMIEVTDLLKRPNAFALRVKGNSMIDALINDGDVVIMESAETAQHNGQMVAAWILEREETTLKKYFQEPNGQVRLQPANPTMEPFFFPADQVRVQGRVIGVIRDMS